MENRNSVPMVLGGLLVGLIFFMGACTNSVLNYQPAPTATPTKVARVVGWEPTATPTEKTIGDQIFGQLPTDVQASLQRRLLATPSPKPANYVDFEVGKNGCRYTVNENVTEKFTGSLAGDCVEILNALNPTPAPTATPTVTPTATPSPAATEFIGAMYDPRPDANGVIIEVRGRYGEWYATASRELEAGSGIFHIQALPSNDIIVSGAVVYMTTDANGQPAIELDYWNGSAVRSELFVLDDWFPMRRLASEEPTPTATPTPEPITVQYNVQKVAIGFPLWIRYVPGEHVLAFYRGNMRGDDTLLDKGWFVDPVGEVTYARQYENAIEYIYKVAFVTDPKEYVFIRGRYQLPPDWDK